MKQVASVGNKATNVNSETHICLNFQKGVKQVAQFYQCSKCKSPMYCSQICQGAECKNRRALCDNVHT